jgi:hypothetical protein
MDAAVDLGGADSGELDFGVADLGCSSPSDLGCNASTECCNSLLCSAYHQCVSACGFAGVTCGPTAPCCIGLWCDSAGTHCRGCLGAGRAAAGQPCPNGNNDCCSNQCSNGFCAA